MTNIGESAKAYEPPKTLNISDLDEVSVDLNIQDKAFDVKESDGTVKETIHQKIIEIDGKEYRVPNSVLKQLKVLLEDNPSLKKFKVLKTGEGMQTIYQVVPITKP